VNNGVSVHVFCAAEIGLGHQLEDGMHTKKKGVDFGKKETQADIHFSRLSRRNKSDGSASQSMITCRCAWFVSNEIGLGYQIKKRRNIHKIEKRKLIVTLARKKYKPNCRIPRSEQQLQSQRRSTRLYCQRYQDAEYALNSLSAELEIDIHNLRRMRLDNMHLSFLLADNCLLRTCSAT
jgi:hypothetical protein